METILSVQNLSAFYGSHQVLHELNVSIQKGALTAIIGPSGCGKSTFLLCLNRMIAEKQGARQSGTISLHEEDCAKLPPDELRRRIGLVFQNPQPFPFSIERNITFALRYHGIKDRQELKRKSEKYLKQVGLYQELSGSLNKSALELSGGQQQRLCIARALAVEPEILLLDEPASALDIRARKTLEKLLMDMKQTYTMIMVTHNLGQARRLAVRVIFMNEGRIVEEGPTEQVFTRPTDPMTRDFINGVYG